MTVIGSVDSKPIARPDAPQPNLAPEEIKLADGSYATVFPFYHSEHIPLGLLARMCDEFNDEIVEGKTYPLIDTLSMEEFLSYWLGDFTAVMLAGKLEDFKAAAAARIAELAATHPSAATDPLQQHFRDSATANGCVNLIPLDADWDSVFLGTFHVQPNYPGRCSHNCNAGFLVSTKARGKRVGTEMAKVYLKWAPQLGYTYSVFNLVFESNERSLKLWDSLGFNRIGRVPEAAVLKGFDEPQAAIIYGKKLV